MPRVTRRSFLAGSAAALACSTGLDRLWAETDLELESRPRMHPSKRGHRVAVLPFADEPEVALGVVVGHGLSGRRLLDLSTVEDGALVTPTDRYYIRTRTPDYLPSPESWRLAVRTLTGTPLDLPMRDLVAMAEPQGTHLCESTDNGLDVRFGMMSAAEWRGIPLGKLLARYGTPAEEEWLVLVEGFDRFASKGVEKSAGASWVFTPQDLESTGAFLATEMNGAPLLPDLGAPARLVVPGWYGCTWIKWVHSVVMVPAHTTATPHMREYADRTRQAGRPRLAKDYAPAVIDPAALPVRIERWRWRGYYYYRICGVAWGGAAPVESVLIRLDPKAPFEPVDWFPPPESAATWSLWSHDWCPPKPGRYRIDLAVGGSRLRTRRLADGHYLRQVDIEEI